MQDDPVPLCIQYILLSRITVTVLLSRIGDAVWPLADHKSCFKQLTNEATGKHMLLLAAAIRLHPTLCQRHNLLHFCVERT
jgi:hypothetical protein